MRKVVWILLVDAFVLAVYVAAFAAASKIGASGEELKKLVPASAASALGNIATLSLALGAILKTAPRFSVHSPEKEDWRVSSCLIVDCHGSRGVRLQGVDSELLNLVAFNPVTDERPIEVTGCLVEEGRVAEFVLSFEIEEGNKAAVVRRRRVVLNLSYRMEGTTRTRRKRFRLRNPLYQ
ncbi:MAG TPA: hypothetical protein VMV72_04650 [Verrucomicrobiae bacterium]|nr:hypothetical protein [Verrucomicrobiae bacterium]